LKTCNKIRSYVKFPRIFAHNVEICAKFCCKNFNDVCQVFRILHHYTWRGCFFVDTMYTCAIVPHTDGDVSAGTVLTPALAEKTAWQTMQFLVRADWTRIIVGHQTFLDSCPGSPCSWVVAAGLYRYNDDSTPGNKAELILTTLRSLRVVCIKRFLKICLLRVDG